MKTAIEKDKINAELIRLFNNQYNNNVYALKTLDNIILDTQSAIDITISNIKNKSFSKKTRMSLSKNLTDFNLYMHFLLNKDNAELDLIAIYQDIKKSTKKYVNSIVK